VQSITLASSWTLAFPTNVGHFWSLISSMKKTRLVGCVSTGLTGLMTSKSRWLLDFGSINFLFLGILSVAFKSFNYSSNMQNSWQMGKPTSRGSPFCSDRFTPPI
jgi:hypothetical protein